PRDALGRKVRWPEPQEDRSKRCTPQRYEVASPSAAAVEPSGGAPPLSYGNVGVHRILPFPRSFFVINAGRAKNRGSGSRPPGEPLAAPPAILLSLHSRSGGVEIDGAGNSSSSRP